jgi:peptidoglycan/xylan/chitin deacetylase (PgdA/CDA1 family)
VLEVARSAGVFELVRDSRWRRQRLLILAYHGVSLEDEHLWRPGLYMSPEVFESRLQAIQRGGYAVLPFDEALTALREGRLPPRSVTLTFDDGNYDFYSRAFPALKRYGFPATVYLTTYYCEYNRPVFNLVCSYMLWKKKSRETVNIRPLTGDDQTFDLSSPDAQAALVKALVDFTRAENLSARDKDDLAARLARVIDFDYDALRARRILHLMNPDEVSELARQSVSFQLHTHRHNCPHDIDSFTRELQDNRIRVERLTARGASHFCYPCGRYKPYFLPWLEREHIQSATTCDPGLAAPDTSPLLLPRFIDTQEVPAVRFEGWLSGVAAWLPGRRTAAEM